MLLADQIGYIAYIYGSGDEMPDVLPPRNMNKSMGLPDCSLKLKP